MNKIMAMRKSLDYYEIKCKLCALLKECYLSAEIEQLKRDANDYYIDNLKKEDIEAEYKRYCLPSISSRQNINKIKVNDKVF